MLVSVDLFTKDTHYTLLIMKLIQILSTDILLQKKLLLEAFGLLFLDVKFITSYMKYAKERLENMAVANSQLECFYFWLGRVRL